MPKPHYLLRLLAPALMLLWLAPAVASPVWEQATWVASLGASSDVVLRGLSQTNGHGAVQGGVGLRHVSGVYGNLGASSTDTRELRPDPGNRSAIALDLLAGYGQSFARDWRWDVDVAMYRYHDDVRNMNYNHHEFGAALEYRSRLRAAASGSPKATDHGVDGLASTGPMWNTELAAEWPLRHGVSLSGGIGYNDLDQVAEVDFFFGSIGANWRWRRLNLSLAWFTTDSNARERYTDGRADDRLVLSTVLIFGGR